MENRSAERTAPANPHRFFEAEGCRDPRRAREVAPGERWAFVEHRSMAEVIAAERLP